MKRFLVLFIALVYLAVSSGFTVHMHYCMGHFVSASLLAEDDGQHTCDRCGMEKKSGNSCCKDDYKVYKHNPDHAAAKTVILTFSSLVATLPPAPIFPADAARPVYTTVQVPAAHGPPHPPDLPIYLKVCSLRIGDCC